MHTVLDPSIIFISENDWQNEDKRDAFLEHLIENLQIISEHQLTRFYWTSELEQLLWTDPTLPPWRLDRDWKLQIIPIISRLWRTLLDEVDIELEECCECQPELLCPYEKANAIQLTLKLILHIMTKNENFFFCLGISNNAPSFSFSHNDLGARVEPVHIRRSTDWLPFIRVVDLYWPITSDIKSIRGFRKAIEITALTHFNKKAEDFLYNYEFDSAFIEHIIQEKLRREDILYCITRRLLLSQKEASADKGLNDEPVRGLSFTRRMRVTKSCRIHYSYPDRQIIRFTSYFGEGEHDSGL